MLGSVGPHGASATTGVQRSERHAWIVAGTLVALLLAMIVHRMMVDGPGGPRAPALLGCRFSISTGNNKMSWVVLVIAGFPVALVAAWVYDVTSHGVVRGTAGES